MNREHHAARCLFRGFNPDGFKAAVLALVVGGVHFWPHLALRYLISYLVIVEVARVSGKSFLELDPAALRNVSFAVWLRQHRGYGGFVPV